MGWGASTYESTSRQDNSLKLKLNFNSLDKLKPTKFKTNRLYNLRRILLLRCQFSIYGFLPKKEMYPIVTAVLTALYRPEAPASLLKNLPNLENYSRKIPPYLPPSSRLVRKTNS